MDQELICRYETHSPHFLLLGIRALKKSDEVKIPDPIAERVSGLEEAFEAYWRAIEERQKIAQANPYPIQSETSDRPSVFAGISLHDPTPVVPPEANLGFITGVLFCEKGTEPELSIDQGAFSRNSYKVSLENDKLSQSYTVNKPED